MNVIFLDFDGVLDTGHSDSMDDIEERIKILGDICREYDCKVVIEAGAKDAIDENTMEIYSDWVQDIFDLFIKYGIECIGRTPNVEKDYDDSHISMWKEDEILLYLWSHPEIEHYCVIDDDDAKNIFHWDKSDLDKVRDHLVTTVYYSRNPDEEGLLPRHKEEVGRILKKQR